MSGIEIAGLVLAVLPLMISATEHCRSSMDPVLAFLRWGEELDKAMRELWLQHTY